MSSTRAMGMFGVRDYPFDALWPQLRRAIDAFGAGGGAEVAGMVAAGGADPACGPATGRLLCRLSTA